MTRKEDSITPTSTSLRHTELSNYNRSESSISSFDLLTPYNSSTRNASTMSAAAALLLQAAADNRINEYQQPSQYTLPRVSSSIMKQCRSPTDKLLTNLSPALSVRQAAVAAAAAASRIPHTSISHSPSANSSLQAAIALAMVASSSPTSTTVVSSGQQTDPSTECRTEDMQTRPFNVLFCTPSSYDLSDNGGDSRYANFSHPSSNSASSTSFTQFAQFNKNVSADLSASSCLANAVLFPASLASALGQQAHYQQARQAPSPSYIQTIVSTKSAAAFTMLHKPSSPMSTRQPAASPNSLESTRLTGTTNANTSSIVQDEGIRKREQRLLKNREAARECRRKKKEYVRCLEHRVAVLESQNQQLIDELQKIKAFCLNEGAIISESRPLIDTARKSLSERCIPDGLDYVDSMCIDQRHASIDLNHDDEVVQQFHRPIKNNSPQPTDSIPTKRYALSVTPNAELSINVEASDNERTSDLRILTSTSCDNLNARGLSQRDIMLLQSLASEQLSTLKDHYNLLSSGNALQVQTSLTSSTGEMKTFSDRLKIQSKESPHARCNFLSGDISDVDQHEVTRGWQIELNVGEDFPSLHSGKIISPCIPSVNHVHRKLNTEQNSGEHVLHLVIDKTDHDSDLEQ